MAPGTWSLSNSATVRLSSTTTSAFLALSAASFATVMTGVRFSSRIASEKSTPGVSKVGKPSTPSFVHSGIPPASANNWLRPRSANRSASRSATPLPSSASTVRTALRGMKRSISASTRAAGRLVANSGEAYPTIALSLISSTASSSPSASHWRNVSESIVPALMMLSFPGVRWRRGPDAQGRDSRATSRPRKRSGTARAAAVPE